MRAADHLQDRAGHVGVGREQKNRLRDVLGSADAPGRHGLHDKQTIYRWWPSKGAVLLEALTDWGDALVPSPNTGSLRGDLIDFLRSTFRRAGEPSTAALLRTLASEALRDPHTAELLRQFTETRRDTLHTIVEHGRERGELAADVDLDLLVDQAYGLFWYRFLLGHVPLTDEVAGRLADSLTE